MKICIVNYEMTFNNGILSKYAFSLERELKKLGADVSVKPIPDESANINYHINYLAYRPTDTIDTLMITHLTGDANQTREYKTEFLRNCLGRSYGITMSKVLMEKLVEQGFPKNRLFYVLPAHDSIPRRPREIAILTDIKPDKRKREWMYEELFKTIDKDKFLFRIMGKGWDIDFNGINKDLYPEFEMGTYKKILANADYVLYVGDEDCVSQSLIDAHQAGIKTIFPGMDHNFEFGVDLPFNNQEDLNNIFSKLAENDADKLTWANYTKNHLRIWENIVKTTKKKS